MINKYRYRFKPDIPIREVTDSLMLAVLAAECLYGRSRIHLEADFRLIPGQRSCEITAATDVGCAIARIFTGFLTREFGENAFNVHGSPPETVFIEAKGGACRRTDNQELTSRR